MVDTLVESSYYMSQGEIVTSVFSLRNLYSASLQFYHAYIAWSLVYTVVNEPEGRIEAHGVMAASPVAAESKLGVSLLSHSELELGEGTAASI